MASEELDDLAKGLGDLTIQTTFRGLSPITELDQKEAESRPAICWDERMLLHQKDPLPDEHPERPARCRAILEHLQKTGIWQTMQRVPVVEAPLEWMKLVHEAKYVKSIVEHSEEMLKEDDVYTNQHSPLAACLAVGGLVEICKTVLAGLAPNGIALIRPPGHHAETCLGSGFCLYNNVAVASQYAITHLGLKKVLIVDWDVHHGNGTQNIFEDSANVMYVSTHRGPDFYPGTGFIREAGTGDGAGFNVNIPMPKPFLGDVEYRASFDQVIMPMAREFDPELVIISCGFDAAEGDPLGSMCVSPAGYAYMTRQLCTLAQGKVVVALEGGYDLHAISVSMAAVASTLLEVSGAQFQDNDGSESSLDSPDWLEETAKTRVDADLLINLRRVKKVHKKYWKCFQKLKKSKKQKAKADKKEASSETHQKEEESETQEQDNDENKRHNQNTFGRERKKTRKVLENEQAQRDKRSDQRRKQKKNAQDDNGTDSVKKEGTDTAKPEQVAASDTLHQRLTQATNVP